MDGTFVNDKMIMSGWSDGHVVTWCDGHLIRVQDGFDEDRHDLRKCELPLWRRHQLVSMEKAKTPQIVREQIERDLKYNRDEPWFPISYMMSVGLSLREIFFHIKFTIEEFFKSK